MLGSVLEVGDRTVNKTKEVLALMEFTFQCGIKIVSK